MIVDDSIIKQHGLVVAAVYAVVVATPTIKQTEIARECNISVKTAQRALETLQQIGYIRIMNNKPNSNTYEVLNRSEKREKVMKIGRPGKKILCINDGMIFESCTAAAKNYKVTRSAISRQVNGQLKSVRGLYFTTISGTESYDELHTIRMEYLSQSIRIEDLL